MPMSERHSAAPVSPAYDDNHLFQSGTVKVMVDLSPEWRRSPQGDVVLRGYIAGKEIEVVFSGRRQAAAMQLTQRMHQWAEHVTSAAKVAGKKPSKSDVRQKIQVDGVWRVRLLAEQHGMPVRRFQLVAARWKYRGADGIVHVDGEVPYG